MKVIVITNLFPNNVESARATYNRVQFRFLQKYCDLKVIAPIAWTDRFLYWRKNKKIKLYEKIDGLDVYHPTYYFVPKFLRSLYGFFFFLSILYTFIKIYKKHRADVIYSTWAYPDSFAAVLLAKIFQVPVVAKIHGSDIHSVEGIGKKQLTCWALTHAEKVISVSHDLARKTMAMGVPVDKIVTIYNGVDANVFKKLDKVVCRKKLKISDNEKIVLYVGNLKSIKGSDLLADTIKELKKSCYLDLQLVVIGDGGLRKSILVQIQSYGLAANIKLLGSLKHNEIASWMNAADVLFVPSRNEGVPNVILEAMSIGLPVVATKVGGIPEVVIEKRTGFLVASHDARSLADALLKALCIDWDSDEIMNYAKQYSWQHNAECVFTQLEDCFNEEKEV